MEEFSVLFDIKSIRNDDFRDTLTFELSIKTEENVQLKRIPDWMVFDPTALSIIGIPP